MITIAICCYNSTSRIVRTLQSIAGLARPQRQVEVLVVDNCSTDGTSDVVRSTWNKLYSPFDLCLVPAAPVGLSVARMKAIEKSAGELVVFCDDDNLLDPDYLVEAEKIMDSDPRIGCLGGQSYPVFPPGVMEAPRWFYTYASSYAVGVQAIESGDVSGRGYLWGSGMVVRLDVLRTMIGLGLEFVTTGRKGTDLSSGEDSELCLWMMHAGYRLWYSEKLIFGHIVPASRLAVNYVKKLHKGFNEAGQLLSAYSLSPRFRSLAAKGKPWPIKPLFLAYYWLYYHLKSEETVRRNCFLIERSLPLFSPRCVVPPACTAGKGV
ncbi:glycosyltransferase [Synechococcus sp. CBW1107]|uniref:glycosyltransferase n=1 Tax=Synechococcus sp. CBW1107 TaxID=2789857 RepID=UPI002AD308FF|nr:glycosyltransferase [Synechococcus sp. CBW1107]CAK6686929.1 hypothetical protein ICNINCKA_00100 [Synechococcus sp. CBW1107]